MDILTFAEIVFALYAGVLFIYLAATRWLDRWPPFLLALAPFAVWLFLPIIVTPLILALAGSTGVAWYATLAAAMVYAFRYLRPGRRPANFTANPGPLRVVTANLLKTNMRTKDVVTTLRTLDADVVAVQELKQWHAQAFEALADLYPHQLLHPSDDHKGTGILSRHPLTDGRWWLKRPDAYAATLGRVEAPQGAFWLVNMHTRIPKMIRAELGPLRLPVGSDTASRSEDIADLVGLVGSLEGPAILLGDMNTTPEELDYRLIPADWTSAYAAAGSGFGFSFPVDALFFGVNLPFPIFMLDHVFLRGDWLVGEARFEEMPGSDHRCLVADVELG